MYIHMRGQSGYFERYRSNRCANLESSSRSLEFSCQPRSVVWALAKGTEGAAFAAHVGQITNPLILGVNFLQS